MSQKVNLNITPTSEHDFQVILSIDHGDCGRQIIKNVPFVPNNLETLRQYWKKSYSNLVIRAITLEEEEGEETDTTNSCPKSAENFKNEFQNWFSFESGWQEIQQYLEECLNLDEEIQFTLQTRDFSLQQLPWHEWSIFKEYPRSEIALSTPEFQPAPGSRGIIPQQQVRILVVLGANHNIDVGRDLKLITDVEAHGAYIHPLTQPSPQELRDALKHTDGWHIFFFAGHSQTKALL